MKICETCEDMSQQMLVLQHLLKGVNSKADAHIVYEVVHYLVEVEAMVDAILHSKFKDNAEMKQPIRPNLIKVRCGSILPQLARKDCNSLSHVR